MSLFTSLYCTRFLFDLAMTKIADQKIKAWLLGGSSDQVSKGRQFDFLKTFPLCTISAKARSSFCQFSAEETEFRNFMEFRILARLY